MKCCSFFPDSCGYLYVLISGTRLSPLEKEKGSGCCSEQCRCGKSGGKSTLFGRFLGRAPFSVMLLLPVNAPRSHTAFPGIPETCGSVRNSHSASNSVITPEEAESRDWASLLFYMWHYRFSSHRQQSWGRQSERQRLGKRKESREGTKWLRFPQNYSRESCFSASLVLWFSNIFRLFYAYVRLKKTLLVPDSLLFSVSVRITLGFWCRIGE